MPAEKLDPRGVRFTAAITSTILAIGLLTTSWRVMAAQTVLFGLCAFIGMRLNPWGALYRKAVQPRLAPIDPADREAAGRLAGDATQALQELGVQDLAVEVRDFTAWSKAKPRAGTLELWLALPENLPG